jgi:molybdenum cofactor cytidylyltransferase
MILAAGASSRMGAPKALLPLNDRSFIEGLVDLYRDAGLDPLYVVVPALHRAEIEAKLPVWARVVVNEHPQEGQLSSLKIGLETLGGIGNAVLVGLVDQPTIAPSTLEALLTTWRKTRARAVVPRFQSERGHPVVLARSIYPAIYRAKGNASLRQILESYASEVVELDLDDPRILLNVNNPADYRALVERYGLPHEVQHATGWEGFVISSKSKSGRE